MCADIYTKGFTDAAKWVEVCDLINIVDPARLRGLIQHVADVCAGLDDPVPPVAVSGKLEAQVGNFKKNAPPPSGGDTQNHKKAIPAPCMDVLHVLSADDRAALVNLVQGIEHGTKIGCDATDVLLNKKLFTIATLINLLIGDYISCETWNYLTIGNDSRVLEFDDDSELVRCIVCLGEAGATLGHTGSNDTPFQQVNSGEIRVFHSPSHLGTVLVTPCAIVLGFRSPTSNATPAAQALAPASDALAIPPISINNEKGGFNRVLLEGCCAPDSVLCKET